MVHCRFLDDVQIMGKKINGIQGFVINSIIKLFSVNDA